MAKISRRSNWPLYLQIADDLRRQVLQQQLAPGERLPSEHSLMDSYDASRQTVRRAVTVLKAEGLLEGSQGLGVFVRATAPLLRRLSPQRREAEKPAGFSVDLDGSHEITTEKEAGQTQAPATIASRLGIREGDQVRVWRWRVLSDGQPIQLATSYLPRRASDRRKIGQPDTPEGVYALLTDQLGVQLERLTEQVTSRMPQPSEASALDLGPGTPVVLIARTAYAEDGKPVEACDVTMAADRQELEYEVPAGGSTRLLTSGGALSKALLEVVHGARDILVAVGSRSRQPAYLNGIEQALQNCPDLVHYRVLMGPPHNQVFKDHLLRLLELRDPASQHGGKTLHIGMVDDLTEDPEVFFTASENAAVVTLPSLSTPGNFDTAVFIGDTRYAQGLVQHARALYGKRRLETVEAVNELPVLR